jgi:hypothetical protein
MKQRPCRLQLEELEQRTVPTPFFSGGHFVGCHPIRENITTGLHSRTSASGNIPNGLLQGKVALSNLVTSRSFLKEDFSGTLTITTTRGTIRIDASGSLGLLSGSVGGMGTVKGGTGAFQGVTGTVFLQGTADLIAQTLQGTLTGTICGQGAHHAHGNHR